MLTRTQSVADQHFVAAIRRHRATMAFGTVTGELTAVTIDANRPFGRLPIRPDVESKSGCYEDTADDGKSQQIADSHRCHPLPFYAAMSASVGSLVGVSAGSFGAQ
jgi:hypothetical protein